MTFWFSGKEDETIAVNFEEIKNISSTGGFCVLQGNDEEEYVLAIPGTIDDIIYEVYQHGYEEGMNQEAENHFLFQKKMQEGTTNVKILREDLLEPKTSTADIEVVSDEDKPKVRGYITDKLGFYVNVNHIVKFWEESGVQITMAEDSLRQLHHFDMPLGEFKEILAKAQEELR